MGRQKKGQPARKRSKLPDLASAQKKSSSFGPPTLTKNRITNPPIRKQPSATSNRPTTTHQGSSQAVDEVQVDQDVDEVMQPSSSSSFRPFQSHLRTQHEDEEDQGDLEDQSPESFFFRPDRLDATITGRKDSSVKAYIKELRKVLENADVLLEVLDARDPIGCRSFETERAAMRAGKKVVLILNKIDLVPKSNVEAWLKHLRHDFPTLAFKASTQSQRSNLSQGASSFSTSSNNQNKGKDTISSGSEALGAGALLQLIKNYSRNLNIKTSVTVGIFGAPNVGKSSLVNSLKRARVCSVASTPGHTKVVQGVMLDKSVRLLDCPGIVFSDPAASSLKPTSMETDEERLRRQSALLRNVVKVELVEDPVTPVEAILARVKVEELCQIYGIGAFKAGDAQDFLMRVALQRGRIGRGGKLDLEGTARIILHDWNVGRIKYFTEPPALHRSAVLTRTEGGLGGAISNPPTQATPASSSSSSGTTTTAALAESSSIVSSFGEAFDLAGLLGEADAEIFGGGGRGGGGGESKGHVPPPPPPPRRLAEMEGEEEIVDDHQTEPTTVADTSRITESSLGKRPRASSSSSSSSCSSSDEEEQDPRGSRSRRTKPTFAPLPDVQDQDSEVEEEGKPDPSSWKGSQRPSWMDRQEAKATSTTTTSSKSSSHTSSLSTFFSPSELENLAVPRGISRKKLKKAKKRAQRSGAGLVEDLESLIGLRGEEEEEEVVKERRGSERRGIFEVPEPVLVEEVEEEL